MESQAALIVFAGRAGDRNNRAMAGSRVLGRALGAATGLVEHVVGSPEPALATAWPAELEAARAGLTELQGAIEAALRQARRPIGAIGRCAAALATLPVIARARPDAMVVWFDAHGDSNLPENSPTGYLGGMVLTGAAGCWRTGLGDELDLSNVVLVGSRDLDDYERQLIEEGVIRLIAPGPDLGARLQKALQGRPAYIHIDCDVLEPGIVPFELPVSGGLTLADLSEACAALSEGEVVGLEIAEYEASWADGAPGDPNQLVAALAPLLTVLTT
ncbi:MAG TPA: arginase family protein [Candidatus Polarisedimenticolia bacterium]|nr:arginase family protein [Candidatus Polarisedimenticolia bacterium]